MSLPVLRKDFIATAYQVLEARAAGADLVLLIVAALDQPMLEPLHSLILDLGMTPLVEAHSAEELDAGGRSSVRDLIGINARDLSTFAARPRPLRPAVGRIPADAIKIAESAVLAPAGRRALPRRRRRRRARRRGARHE